MLINTFYIIYWSYHNVYLYKSGTAPRKTQFILLAGKSRNKTSHLIERFDAQKTQTDNRSPWTPENPNVQGNYALYMNLYTVLWTCVLAAYTNRSTKLLHHKWTCTLIWTQFLRTRRQKIDFSGGWASAVCWAEASSRGWFSWNLAA